MANEKKGVVFGKGFAKPAGMDGCFATECLGNATVWAVDHRIHKFINDEVWCKEGDVFYFLDGYVENIPDIKLRHNVNSWNQAFCREWDATKVINLRGGFCGIIVGKESTDIFVDHTGNRSMYYFSHNNNWIISTSFFDIIKVLKHNNVKYSIDEQAVEYMLTQGFMLDDTTFCKEIKRVCPGCIVTIGTEGLVQIHQYYKIDNTNINHSMTEQEAISGIDYYFRQAIKREFSKDNEYGYAHLVDLSGGLDSRMTCFVAHDMGYRDQINLTYCRKNYLDFSIAQDIATDLGHRFLFTPLDDFNWYLDIDENTVLLNGSTPYGSSTGANVALKMLKGCNCGIEHTGMIGDAIIGTFYSDEVYNYDRPDGREKAFSHKLNYEIKSELLDLFNNREQFSLYTRGLLGAQSSYMLRQNYFETASPFLDPDFLDFVMTIPFKYRTLHHIYLKWISSKYPKAAEYGWESWYGLKPTDNNRKIKIKIYAGKYIISEYFKRVFNKERSNNMIPLDYWLAKHSEIAMETDKYINKTKGILSDSINTKIVEDVEFLYDNGSASEKMQALTVCAMCNLMMRETDE